MNRSHVAARLHSCRAEAWEIVELLAAQLEVEAFVRARRARAVSEETYERAEAS